jgi:peptidoglycan/LPS O-acetylase OafA/YrhL
MQEISNVQSGVALPARPVAATKVKTGSRLAYVDVVRMVIIIMVIMMHTAITYGAFGDWTYHDPAASGDELTSILLSLFIFIEQSFFMGLMFFFAGYFTPGSYDHKGTGRFWKDRLMRLAIPMVIYTYFLSRIPNYLDEIGNNGLNETFWHFSARTFWTQADGGPTWFVFALLAFSLGYTLWRLASRGLRLDLSWVSRLPAPGTKTLLGMGLVFAAGMFAVAQKVQISQSYPALGAYNLLFAFFPAYILMYAGGMLAYRNQWLTSISGKLLRFWGWVSAAMVLALPALMVLGGAIEGNLDTFLSGMTWQCAAFSLWFGLSCVAFSTTLTLWLRDRVLPQSKLAAFAGPNNFTVYLIHPLVLVPFCYAMSFITLPGIVKFGLASLVTVVVSYLVAVGLRRVPGAKAIL